MFNVYVSEFSIGFGPALFTKKKENQETRFSIRAIPLGGYCAIVGESLPEFTEEEYAQLSDKDKELVDLYKTVPNERKLDGISRWKRAIIMIAGVTLNFILGFILLIVSYSITVVPTIINNYVTVSENSNAYKANWTSEDVIKTSKYEITINGNTSVKEFDCEENNSNLYYSISVLTNNEFKPQSENDVAKYTLVTMDNKVINFELKAFLNNGEYTWPKVGVSFSYNYEKGTYRYNFGEIMKNSCKDFGEFSIAIFKGIGQLFTKDGIQNVGGMISIFTVQQQAMHSGFNVVIRLWALISINLGIMNLLPFPGLDGWHFLVLIVEGITRKELPKKFKTIMSNIGMIILFGLMILVTLKDIIGLF
ncbi:putative uncharacterized protein [Firmicutes bacterium CAG:449]|nr:putative uncharacterized protein [Firmicutes bacterium CAG:449]